MIITLKGANFANSNIGTLDSYSIRFVGSGVTNSNTSVDRGSNTGYTTTIVLKDGYELDGAIKVEIGGTDVTNTVTIDELTITISTKINGNVVITVPTKNTAGGDEEPETSTNYAFTINPDPTSATVTLSATGYSTVSGTGNQSITVANGTKVDWSVSAEGYTTRTGNWTISDGNKTENITLSASGGEGGTTTLTLYQGYANESNIASLDTRVRTDFIEGAFSVECNSGYVIRAIYEYSTPKATSGISIVSASENKTSYTGGTTGKYYIITFCKSDATASISPTENIVANFTGTIYAGDSGSGNETTTGETIDVNGIRITMGQLVSSGIKTHTGRAYTVDPLNDKTTISTSGDFVMIPILDTDNDLSNSGTITCYTNADGSFATSADQGGTLKYHATLDIAHLKTLASSANVYVMFKHNTASSFELSDLASAVTIS